MFFYNFRDFVALNMTLKYVMFLKKMHCFTCNRHVYYKSVMLNKIMFASMCLLVGSFGPLGLDHWGLSV